MIFQLKAGSDLLGVVLEVLIKVFGRLLGRISPDESGEIGIGELIFLFLLFSVLIYGLYRLIKAIRKH